MTQKLRSLQKTISPSKSLQDSEQFNIHSIKKQIFQQENMSIKDLQNQIKELKLTFAQTFRDFSRLRKDIELRPTCHTLMQNTILITTAIQSDPNIMKLLHTKEEKLGQVQFEEDLNQSDAGKQLRRVSINLGKKLSKVNDGLPLLYSLIKQLQKQYSKSAFELKQLIDQKTQNIQEQVNQIKIDQITERINLSEKLQSQYEMTQQKIRQIETKNSWQFKDLKAKLHQKLQKETFENKIQEFIQKNQKRFQLFISETNTLVSPQRIKDIESLIKQNREKNIKEIVECNLRNDKIEKKIYQELVNLQFYKKQRTHLEKRISTLNINFQEVHQKVLCLQKVSQDQIIRLKVLQKDKDIKTKSMQQMKTVLKSISISEEFQQLLSKIDPDKILSLQTKVETVQAQNKLFSKLMDQINEEIDRIYNKFDIAGIMMPNKTRDKEFQLNDLKQIIDQYFVENRFGNKISKIQAELNEGKASVETIKGLEKKLARLQKEADYSKVIQQFRQLEQSTKRQKRVFEEKLLKFQSQLSITDNYFQGLMDSIYKKGLPDQKIDKIKSSEGTSINRLARTLTENKFIKTSKSWRKINLLDGSKQKDQNPNFYKNTASSTRKNLLKPSKMFLGNFLEKQSMIG